MQTRSSKRMSVQGVSKNPRVACLVDAQADMAQSLIWDGRTNRLFWINPPARQLLSVSLTSGFVQTWLLPCPIGAIALCGGGRILVVLLDGIYLFDPSTHDLHFLAELDARWIGECLCGRVGPDNAFWVGGTEAAASGSLLRMASDGTIAWVAAMNVGAPAGLGWSADGRTMYGADREGGWIGRWAFDPATRSLSQGSRLVTRGEDLAEPSGGAVDVEGSYWTCDAANGFVSRFAPDGRVLTRIRLPVPAPTTCCFGGSDMRLLFVGSRRAGVEPLILNRSPLAGGVFMIPIEVPGVSIRRFEISSGQMPN
jgi:sugar lactone lactonase YvrE